MVSSQRNIIFRGHLSSPLMCHFLLPSRLASSSSLDDLDMTMVSLSLLVFVPDISRVGLAPLQGVYGFPVFGTGAVSMC